MGWGGGWGGGGAVGEGVVGEGMISSYAGSETPAVFQADYDIGGFIDWYCNHGDSQK